jgi:hypothetical protein
MPAPIFCRLATLPSGASVEDVHGAARAACAVVLGSADGDLGLTVAVEVASAATAVPNWSPSSSASSRPTSPAMRACDATVPVCAASVGCQRERDGERPEGVR